MRELKLPFYLNLYKQMGYVLGEVRLNKICYDYRDDIAFRSYYLMTRDNNLMNIWKKMSHGKKDGKRSYTARYINKLLDSISNIPINTSTNKTQFDWSCAEKKGQILRPVPFAKDKKGVFYPAGGVGRISCAYYLGHRSIPAFIIPAKNSVVWKKNFGVMTKHFQGMPQSTIDMLLFRRIVSNNFMIASIKKKIDRPDFLHQIPELAIRGRYNVDAIFTDKTFTSIIKDKNILNLTLDNGWFDVNCSKFAKSITGYGLPVFKKITKAVYNYFEAKNGTFTSDLKEVSGNFDLIIVNKIIKVPECSGFLENKKIIYDKDDCVIYG